MPEHPSGAGAPRLSVCIATRDRAAFLSETLDALLAQLRPGVELVVVDGASSDGTAALLARAALDQPALRVVRETANSGVDGGYDRAVSEARGAWCWLMTDDDLPAPGAIDRILAELERDPDAVFVNAEVRDHTLGTVLVRHRLGFGDDRLYRAGEGDRLLGEVGDGLSFIGAVVVRRTLWLARSRQPYLGSLFVHVGVLFQAPLGEVRVVGAPLVRIRYGNAGWTGRAFEVWMFKWPGLVWSLPGFSAAARARVCPAQPWRSPARLLLYRALGAYGPEAYRRLVATAAGPGLRGLAWLVAHLPARALNGLLALACLLLRRSARGTIYDLSRCAAATGLSRLVARLTL